MFWYVVVDSAYPSNSNIVHDVAVNNSSKRLPSSSTVHSLCSLGAADGADAK